MTGLATLLSSSALIPSATPSTTDVTGTGDSTHRQTPVVSVSVSGFTQPYSTYPLTYLWHVSSNKVFMSDPTSSSTYFYTNGSKQEAIAYCVVTQASTGKSAQSADINLHIV